MRTMERGSNKIMWYYRNGDENGRIYTVLEIMAIILIIYINIEFFPSIRMEQLQYLLTLTYIEKASPLLLVMSTIGILPYLIWRITNYEIFIIRKEEREIEYKKSWKKTQKWNFAEIDYIYLKKIIEELDVALVYWELYLQVEYANLVKIGVDREKKCLLERIDFIRDAMGTEIPIGELNEKNLPKVK